MKYINEIGRVFDVKLKNNKLITKKDVFDSIIKKGGIPDSFKEKGTCVMVMSYSLNKHSKGYLHYYFDDHLVTYDYKIPVIEKKSGIKVGLKRKRIFFYLNKKQVKKLWQQTK